MNMEPKILSNNFPMIPIAIFLAFIVAESSALRCYRGQQNASMTVYGQPQECPPGSMSCTKIYEPSMHIAQRDCSVTNCTINNMISSVGNCQNSTSYPFNTYCCCYGDGCNSAPPGAFITALSWRSIASSTLLILIPFIMAHKMFA